MKKLHLLILLSIYLFFINGCNFSNNPGNRDKIRVILSWNPGAENAFLYYGLDKKIFEKYNLELEIIPSKGSAIVASALSNNKCDFGFISSDYLINTVYNGNELEAIFTLYHETPVTIYSLQEKEIIYPEDLENKKIAVLVKSATYPQVKNFLKFKRITNYEEVSGTGSYTDISSHNADAAMDYTNYAPITLEAKTGNKPNEIRLSKYYPNFYGTSIATTRKLINENPDLVQRFVSAMLESLELSRKDTLGALKSLIKNNPELEEYVQRLALIKTNEMIYKNVDSLGVGYMTSIGWDSTLINVKILTKTDFKDFDIKKVYDNSFIKKYNEKKPIKK